ncbi:DUF4345 domain-containing protein [Algiphilus aromaticivorans]|jgi:hypothetical protein|uniref:DUF4345 domain-containing protein n=1 Tax=Algiphilus aromaticivorans TaxID=382454 RepID=UPI000693A390|nr:DUF4345 domain-containing protein [Algiphilus aromaticivorans]
MAARWLLGITAVMFVALGLNGLLNPVGHLAPYGLELATPGWLGEVRANYGGMHLGIGLLFALGAVRAEWQRTGLAVLLAFLGGLAVGRTLSVFVDGTPPVFAIAFIAIEWVGAVLAMALLLRRPA